MLQRTTSFAIYSTNSVARCIRQSNNIRRVAVTFLALACCGPSNIVTKHSTQAFQFAAASLGTSNRSSSSFSSSFDHSKDLSLKSMVADNPNEVADVLSTADILDQLRAKMKELDFDVFLVPSDDPHLSEYTAEAYRRRAFVSKFTGSAGTAVILKDDVVFPAPESDSDDEGDSSDKVEYKKALLWTDSRYFNEAGMQLDSDHWTLMKQGQKGVPTLISFLTSLAKAKKKNEDSSEFRIGIDGFVHSASFCKSLEESIKSENAVITTLDENDVSSNIVDEIWGKERPALPSSAFRVHPLKYAGISVSDKLSKVRKEMKKAECSLSVFSTLDDVAYLMNVRASDVDCCPVGKCVL